MEKLTFEEDVMSVTTNDFDDAHPIDLVVALAEYKAWAFDRQTDDQITIVIKGQWQRYSLTLSWSPADETLRLVCGFELDPPQNRLSELYDLLNRVNDLVWVGAFTYWPEHKLVVWRSGLVLTEQMVCQKQIDKIIAAAVAASERFYPAFQMLAWADYSATRAIGVAIAEAYGRA